MIFAKDLPIDEKYPKSSLYWIYHEDKHTDPRTSGYIGVCVSGTEHRFNRHKGDAKNGSHYLVHKAIRKYGDNIKVKTLLTADPEFCLLAEYLLRPHAQMVGTWNLGAGGSASMIGYVPSDETRAKIGKAHKGKVISEDQKAKLMAANTGKKASLETKEKMSVARKGKPKNLSDSERERRRQAIKTNGMHSEASRAKRSLKMIGRELSGEHRQALSDASKGVPKTSEHALNISAALLGKSKSESHIENMRKAQASIHENISPWENYKINADVWATAPLLFDFLLNNPKCGSYRLATKFNFMRCDVATIHRDLRAGWNPLTDEKYLNWLSEYNKEKETTNVT